jgi:hypothetical protein
VAVFALIIFYLPSRPQQQIWTSLSASAGDPKAELRARVATTAGRLESAEGPELATLHDVGHPYWRTTGTGRLRGELREIVFVQGDNGMLAGRADDPPPAFMAEGVVFRP